MGSRGDGQLSSGVSIAPSGAGTTSSAPPISSGVLGRAAIVGAWAAAGLAMLLAPVKLCLFALLFHAPCPGCGMTRAAVALLRGDLARAYALHPLSIVLVPFAGAIIARQIARYVRTGSALGDPLPPWIEPVAAGLVVLLLGVWIARSFGFFGGPVSV